MIVGGKACYGTEIYRRAKAGLMAANTLPSIALGAVPVPRLLTCARNPRARRHKMTSVPGDRPVLNGDQTLQPNDIRRKNAGVGATYPHSLARADSCG